MVDAKFDTKFVEDMVSQVQLADLYGSPIFLVVQHAMCERVVWLPMEVGPNKRLLNVAASFNPSLYQLTEYTSVSAQVKCFVVYLEDGKAIHKAYTLRLHGKSAMSFGSAYDAPESLKLSTHNQASHRPLANLFDIEFSNDKDLADKNPKVMQLMRLDIMDVDSVRHRELNRTVGEFSFLSYVNASDQNLKDLSGLGYKPATPIAGIDMDYLEKIKIGDIKRANLIDPKLNRYHQLVSSGLAKPEQAFVDAYNYKTLVQRIEGRI